MLPLITRARQANVGTAVSTAEIENEAVTAEKVKATEVATLGASTNKFTGKVSFNGAAPPTQASDCGSSNTGLTIALLTEVAGAINTDRTKLNEIRTCLRNHGMMA